MDTQKRTQRAATESHCFPPCLGKGEAVGEHSGNEWYHSDPVRRPECLLEPFRTRPGPHQSKLAGVVDSIAVERNRWCVLPAPSSRAGEAELFGIGNQYAHGIVRTNDRGRGKHGGDACRIVDGAWRSPAHERQEYGAGAKKCSDENDQPRT